MSSQESIAQENPYAAPQAELDVAKPKVIYVNKFNGKLAFWSAVAIGIVVHFLWWPTVQTHRTQPRTTNDYIFGNTIIVAISSVIGLYLGVVSGTHVNQNPPESEQTNPDEPSH